MSHILLTRGQKQSEAFSKAIADCGWSATIWPLLTFSNLISGPIELNGDQSLIFTSARAVEALPDPIPAQADVYCVGPATSIAAGRRGFVNVEDVSGDADRLIERLMEISPRRYLHVRGRFSRGNIAERLSAAGRQTNVLIAYEAIATCSAPSEVHSAIMARKFDAMAFFSPRTAAIFKRNVQEEWAQHLKEMKLFAISAAAAEPVLELGFAEVEIAEHPNGASMCAAICSAKNG